MKLRGFALWEREMLIAISRLGGQKAHQMGVAHVFDSESARLAARKSALVRRRKRAANRKQLEMFPERRGVGDSSDGTGGGGGDV